MKHIDLYLQKQRVNTTTPFIKNRDSILDIGCGDGALFKLYEKKGIGFFGIGIDTSLHGDIIENNYTLLKDSFPSSRIKNKFDIITVLAVFEHIPENEIEQFVLSCKERLNPGGKIILTIPHPFVDYLLQILKFLRLIEMDIQQHHKYDIKRTIGLFEKKGFKLLQHKTFQFGLNNLFIFYDSTFHTA